MEPALQSMIDRLDRLSDEFQELREGVQKAIRIAADDPEMALTRARKVLEYVVRDVYQHRVKEPPGTRPLENLLDRLAKDGHFPLRLSAYANFIRTLGNVGTHSFDQGIAAGDVYQSLTQLMPILQWYFEVERPDSGVHLAVPREPKPPAPARPQQARTHDAVVPKGLRSFDAADSDFFLSLLPGPRGQDGLPGSLRFWKYRIEETREPTFAVGVIYGPSGCGKSSLVKAGLLPRLAPDVVSVYVEATADETEARLLAGLRKRLPGLTAGLDLTQVLAAVGQGEGLNTGQRVLLVLDQFEQWLHAHRGEANPALAQALRQCDGERLRCVLMVRDDFWMALTRFLDELRVELVQGQNAAAVDLFDLIHARKVLTAFGRAFRRLPEEGGALAADQEAFLDQAIGWLAQDGRVISIRLALFAEMIKGKPWTPATLAEAGSMDRVGVAFLDETFRAPALRVHEKAAQAVLEALLPERGTDIKGHMRSYEELRAAAGTSTRPETFAGLLKILDGEVRLITPTDPEGAIAAEGRPAAAAEGQYYQLTHDYLVPSLREWLTRTLRETRRGRARLLLAERTGLWNTKPEDRFLPSLGEWCRIRVLTKTKDWTEPQGRMMQRAGRVHGFRTLGVLVVAAGLVGAGLAIRRRVVEDQQKTTAAGLVQQLLRADTSGVPEIIAAMKDYRRWVDPDLKLRLPQLSEDSHPRLHASLALLPDKGQAEFLFRRLKSASPAELPVIWKLLQESQQAPVQRFWDVLEDPKKDPDERFRAARALALSDTGRDTRRWDAVAHLIADRLLATVLNNPSHYDPLIKALDLVRLRLIAPLSQTFRDPGKPESERALATSILAKYAGDQPVVLADLLMDAAPDPFAVLFPKVQAQAAQALVALKAELSKTTDADGDQENRFQRQARAAVALVRLGQAEDVWPRLRHSPDPSVRSYIVHWLKPLGTDPQALIVKLEGLAHDPVPPPVEGQSRMEAVLFDPVTSLRRALVLSLGEYQDLPAAAREPLVATLLEAYRNDPDAGIHGAAEWTLRQWKQDEELKKADAGLPKLEDRGDRRWYVNSAGQTLVVIEGPVAFEMGSPATEPGRDNDETPHRQRINRRFAVATKEVTREQYERFVGANSKNKSHGIGGAEAYSPDLQGPQVGVNWYDAAAYCNWLSEQEHLEPCYEPNEKGEYAEGMKIAPDFRKRSGYRLPTEAEWEYVCRAGAVTSRYYGGALDLLPRYAWYQGNSPKTQASPCGRLKPNELGLFDLLGNVYEWVQDQNRTYSEDEGKDGDDNIEISLSITDKNLRLLRGVSFSSRPAFVRAAFRFWSAPSYRNIFDGFRPARTYP